VLTEENELWVEYPPHLQDFVSDAKKTRVPQKFPQQHHVNSAYETEGITEQLSSRKRSRIVQDKICHAMNDFANASCWRSIILRHLLCLCAKFPAHFTTGGRHFRFSFLSYLVLCQASTRQLEFNLHAVSRVWVVFLNVVSVRVS
jgi:hypothetical protein